MNWYIIFINEVIVRVVKKCWEVIISDFKCKKKCLEFYIYIFDDIRNVNVWRFDSDSSFM